MEHILDNPAWNALISGNKHLSFGNGQVKYFDIEVSPFVGFDENTPDHFRILYDMLPNERPALIVTTTELEIPVPWKVLRIISGVQMVCENLVEPDEAATTPVLLTEEHMPRMIELTKLTNPGPFGPRTIDFGHYQGIFEADKLAAMAGQRMHAFNYAEISAVCTHPDYTGRGYARQLLLNQVKRIQAASEIPFLHVRNDNGRAIKVYESLGFETRTDVYFYVMLKG